MNNKIAAIIAEFNPFHKGHEYIIRQIKAFPKVSHLIVMMSPDFVQRGGPSIDSKYIRAEQALKAGCDCVLELPVSFSTGAAELFAESAVCQLEKIGVVTDLFFGSECADISVLSELAELFDDESSEFSFLIRENLKNGLSYPLAVDSAFKKTFPQYETLLMQCSSPNDRLSIEYLKALKKTGSGIIPQPIKRINTKSASEIRAARLRLKVSDNSLKADDFSEILAARLLYETAETLTDYEGINSDLAARIKKTSSHIAGFTNLAEQIKTKAYTRARIDRALTHILLNIKKESVASSRADGFPSYLRVLGFRKSFESVLSEIISCFPGKIIIRLSEGEHTLNGNNLSLFHTDIFASELYRQISMIRFPAAPNIPELSRGVIII